MSWRSPAELRPTVLLAAAAALLTAATAWPWLAEPAALRPPAAATRPGGGTAIAALPPLAKFAAIVERPLFSPSRRPSAAAAPLAPAPSGLRYRLIGIVAAGKDRHALLADPSGPQPIEVGEGGTLDGWTVTRIEEDRLLLSGPAGAAVLTLRSAGAAKSAKP